MKGNLILLDEFDFLYETGRPYQGFVCSPEDGTLYYASLNYRTSIQDTPSLPNHKSLRYTNGTRFFRVTPCPELKQVHLERNDLVYDKEGNYLGIVRDQNGVMGEIYIHTRAATRLEWGKKVEITTGEKTQTEKEPEIRDDYTLISKITLTPEAYSKIFTHILSLMEEVDLQKLKNGQVTIHMQKKGMAKKTYFNDWDDMDPTAMGDKTHAQTDYDFLEGFSQASIIIRAHIYSDNLHDNGYAYETAWNIMNLLGAHEYTGHGIRGYNDDDNTHYLAYLYKMGHSTWKYTTKKHKDWVETRMKKYYKEEWGAAKNKEDRRKQGLYHKEGENEDRFRTGLSERLQTRPFMDNNYKQQRFKDWKGALRKTKEE